MEASNAIVAPKRTVSGVSNQSLCDFGYFARICSCRIHATRSLLLHCCRHAAATAVPPPNRPCCHTVVASASPTVPRSPPPRHCSAIQPRQLPHAVALRCYSCCGCSYCSVGVDDGWEGCGEGADHTQHDAQGFPTIDNTFPDTATMVRQIQSLGLDAGWYLNGCKCGERTEKTINYEGDIKDLHNFGFDGKIDSPESLSVLSCD